MSDGIEALARISGIPSDEVRGIWEKAKANDAIVRGCPRHRFSGEAVIGKRKPCDACGGTLSLSDIGNYIRGYKAAGADPNDIWPGYSK